VLRKALPLSLQVPAPVQLQQLQPWQALQQLHNKHFVWRAHSSLVQHRHDLCAVVWGCTQQAALLLLLLLLLWQRTVLVPALLPHCIKSTLPSCKVCACSRTITILQIV
jgi:hypothetical protein